MSLLSFTPGLTTSGPITAGAPITLAPGGFGTYLRVANLGPGVAYVAFFTPPAAPPTVLAPTAVAIPPGAVEIFSVASDATAVAALGDGSGGTLSVTRGVGQ